MKLRVLVALLLATSSLIWAARPTLACSWLDGDRLLVLPNNGRTGLLVFARSLTRLASVPALDPLSNPVVLDDTLYALVFRSPEGRVLVTLDIDTGQATPLREFDVGDVWRFVGKGGDTVDPANWAAPARTIADAGREGSRQAATWVAVASGGIAAIVLFRGTWLAVRRRSGGAA